MIELIDSLKPPPEEETPVISREIKRAAALARGLADRLEWGPDAPLLVPILGGTGAGKSKLFNSLAGYPASPSGFKRPTTMAPVILTPEKYFQGVKRPGFFPGYVFKDAEPDRVVFEPEGPPEIILLRSRPGDDRPLILADAPDFDSVLAANRQAALDLLERSDAVILSTDSVKYADQVVWDYLVRISDADKPAVLIINRLKNPMSAEDYEKRLEKNNIRRTVLRIEDQDVLKDSDLYAPELPALVELKETLDGWLVRREEILAQEAGKNWNDLAFALSGLLDDLHQVAEGLEKLAGGVNLIAGKLDEDLTGKMGVAISGELKNSLILQVQALFVRWDPLRHPRRIMAMPYTFIRDKVLGPLGVLGEGRKSGQTALENEVDRLFEANRETLVLLISELNLEAGEMFSSGSLGRGLMERDEFAALPLSADQVREKYGRVRADLENWVGERSRELAGNLKLGEKMTFYLAQAVSLGLFISIQVHTGGGFSFFDGLVDTALAPILSKITGSALSRDKVKAFEEEAAARHLQGCRGLIAEQARTYLDFLARSEADLSAAAPLASEFKNLTKAMEALR